MPVLTGLIPVPVGCLNLKPGTVRPETGLIPALVGRTLTAVLVGGGSPVVHAVVNKARDPLAGVFEVSAWRSLNNEGRGGCTGAGEPPPRT